MAQFIWGQHGAYVQRALSILEKSLGPDHPATQIIRGNLKRLEAKL